MRKPIKISKQSKSQNLITQLKSHGIHEGKKGEQLQSLDYASLLSLLAIKRAVES